MKLRARGGFTLVELLVSVGLFTVVMAGIASMTSSVLRNQLRLIVANSLDNAATVVRHSLTVALQEATYVSAPAAGSDSETLTAWTNVDDDGITPLVAGSPSRFVHLCVEPGGGALHYYTGAAPMPALVCGGESAGVFHSVVAGGPGYRLAARFFRPPGTANLVRADVSLTLARADGTRRDESVSVKVITRHAKD